MADKALLLSNRKIAFVNSSIKLFRNEKRMEMKREQETEERKKNLNRNRSEMTAIVWCKFV